MASEHSAANHSDADDAHSSPADPVDRRSEDSEERPWRTKDDDDEPKRKRGSWLRETIIIVACVLLVTWILQTFIGRQYVIPSESMESTLIGCQGCTNDRIVIDKLAYRFGDPEPGDVVVFRAPTSSWDGDWESPRSSNPVVHGLQNPGHQQHARDDDDRLAQPRPALALGLVLVVLGSPGPRLRVLGICSDVGFLRRT